MIRLFIAIILPDDFKNKLLETRRYFVGLPEPARWIKPDNLHLTVLFLGWTPEEFLEKIKYLLSLTIVRERRYFELVLEKIILAPPERPVRMIWASFRKSPELGNLQGRLYQELKNLGLQIREEKRELHPHITLCRFPEASRELSQSFPELKISASLPVKSVALMESKLYRSGAEYKLLQEYHLTQR